MEVKREALPLLYDVFDVHGVSILVLMEVKRERSAVEGSRDRARVSILVLMEVKRECCTRRISP